MKLSQMLKACLNPKVLIGLGAVIVLVYIFVPQIVSYAWILLLLACPLSMVLMMTTMNHDEKKQEKVFVCSECDYQYTESEWAKKCSAWCKEHNSCNLEITKHGIPPKHEN